MTARESEPSDARSAFDEAGGTVAGATASQMFGAPCFKIGSKAFCCLARGETAVFKLTGQDHADALELPGSKLFDPGGTGRPMKAWVQVPFAESDSWAELANQAAAFVASTS
ncbi:MAG: hypothetical protein ACR2P2_03825 [Nakamurella sp.]